MNTDKIHINDFTIFHGRNIYSHRPVMKMIVDIGKYGETPTNKIPGFNEKLLALLPGLRTNVCGLGYEGGFLERLEKGTYMAHVLEHVVLEMQAMVGYDLHYGKTRAVQEPSVYYLVYEYENEVCGLECGKASVFILNRLLDGEEIDIGGFIDYLKKISSEAELGPSTAAIVNETKKRNIPVTRIGNGSLIRLGYGKFSRLIEATLTDATSCISADISSNKQFTKFLLSENQIPVPYGKVVFSEISAQMVSKQIGLPVVIKPFDANQGKGVHLNLKTKEEIIAAFRDASKYSNGIIVEQFISGRDYRVLVVGGKVSAVAERLPALVIGDGKHTIEELVKIINEDPRRGEEHEKSLTKIRLDDVTDKFLKLSGMTRKSVPADGEIVKLRGNANLSTGGTSVDCTDLIHPDNAEIAVRAANAIGIDIAGIDIVTEDISKSIYETGGAVVEVNTAPGIRMHLYPSKGTPRNVAKDIVDLLFPDDSAAHFPIVSVTGTNGKTTVVRLIAHVLSATGKTVGMTSTSGTYVNGRCICRGDNSGPRSARSLLSNKSIDAAVLETARGGIVREGLGYDLADVGVITNITGDHLGLDDINTPEDLAFVKSLVVEAVKENGAAVLNAEDELTPFVLERVKRRVVFFCREKTAAEKFMKPNYVVVFLKDGIITAEENGQHQEIIPVSDIPITMQGKIECNVENCLAAAAALYALKIPPEMIAEGFKTFENNAGRFNIFELNGLRIMMDYGHNPAGYKQALKTCRSLASGRLIGVIGMPGDRPNDAMRDVGKQCAGAFNRIIIKEDQDLRGRAPGEVAEIFRKAIEETGFPSADVTIIENERDALKSAVENATPGDFIAIFYENYSTIKDYLESIGAKRIF
jgi:cyanophycin synthetase